MSMVQFYVYLFRFCVYVLFGLSLEVIFSVIGIELFVGKKIPRRVPKKYLEGFVSLYMIPVHGIGCLFGVEFLIPKIIDLNIFIRFLIWAILITLAEVAWGHFYDNIFGFYSWDYYKMSKYRLFKKGYSLWTLVPMWGICGLVIEKISAFLIYLSPFVEKYFT